MDQNEKAAFAAFYLWRWWCNESLGHIFPVIISKPDIDGNMSPSLTTRYAFVMPVGIVARLKPTLRRSVVGGVICYSRDAKNLFAAGFGFVLYDAGLQQVI
jgi:hypothetical protein